MYGQMVFPENGVDRLKAPKIIPCDTTAFSFCRLCNNFIELNAWVEP